VIAQGLDRLMGGFKIAPDQIQDSGSDRSRGIHVNSGSHFVFGALPQCWGACTAIPDQLVPDGVIIRGSFVAGGAVSPGALTMPSGLRLGWEP
jgi:hypothetical protein